MHKTELDPNGLQPDQPGAKLDAGKVRPSLILDGFAHALLAVAEVATDGAIKYSDGGWQHVPDGVRRYAEAKDRHRLHGAIEKRDPTTGHLHLAHEAWNALAALELVLREQPTNYAGFTLPPDNNHAGFVAPKPNENFAGYEPSEQIMRREVVKADAMENYGGSGGDDD